MTECTALNGFASRKFWPVSLAVAFTIENDALRDGALAEAVEVLDIYPSDALLRPYVASASRRVVIRALSGGGWEESDQREAAGIRLYRKLERALIDAIANGDVKTFGRPSPSESVRPIMGHEWINGVLYYEATADLGPESDYDPDNLLSQALNDKPKPWYCDVSVDRDSLLAWLGHAPVQVSEKPPRPLGRKPIDDSKVVERAYAIALETGEAAKGAALLAIDEIYPDGLAKLPGAGSDDSKLLRITTKVQARLDGVR